MKRFLFFWLALGLCLASVRADETIRAVQTHLRQGGFYFGDPSGVYDSETSAAVTRYQIRHGLAISGKLDAATLKALDVTPAKSEVDAESSQVSGTWRRLRNGDMQFLKELNSGVIPPPEAPSTHSTPARSAAAVVKPPTQSQMDPHGPPPRLAEKVPTPTSARAVQGALGNPGDVYGPERLRDYVGAFVLAGLDPQVGAELEFFADRVDYFDERNVPREKIRRDLVRYDSRWPQRRFWLAGELEVARQADGTLRVAFPLRYELRNGPKHSSGEVRKTLVLRKAGDGDLEITAVNEAKAVRR